jgi:hypothetical protein
MDAPLGLLDIPVIASCFPGADFCKPSDGIALRTRPNIKIKPDRFAKSLGDLRYALYRSEKGEGGSGVYVDVRRGEEWFMVRLDSDIGERFWIHKSDIEGCFPLEALLVQNSLFVLDGWDGALRAKPDYKSPVANRLWDQLFLGYAMVAESTFAYGPEKKVKMLVRDKNGRFRKRTQRKWLAAKYPRSDFRSEKLRMKTPKNFLRSATMGS